MLTPVYIMALDELPKHNTGAIVTEVNDFVFDDAAIVACLLRQWDVPAGMIGTAVGDDVRGHVLAKQLKDWGVQGKVRFTKKYKTPLEVNVSDKKGARTYFWQRSEEILETLGDADLSLIKKAKLLYVDWYDGNHIVRAMEEAKKHNVPVFSSSSLRFGAAVQAAVTNDAIGPIVGAATFGIGAMVGPEAFMEVRYLAHAKQRQALELIPGWAGEFRRVFGRDSGGLLHTYRTEDAELIVVALGSVLGTIKDTVDELRASMWVAEQARAAGLKPAGEDGTYFQWWPLRRIERTSQTAPMAALQGAASSFMRCGRSPSMRRSIHMKISVYTVCGQA